MARPKHIHDHLSAGDGRAGTLSEGDRIDLAVNHVKALMQANNAQALLLQARARGGLGVSHAADQKRSCTAWAEYGWPADVTYDMLYWLFRREGIAYGAVDKLLGRCWSDLPEVIEGDDEENKEQMTAWEKRAAVVLTPAVWAKFAEADKRRLVGRWSALILHVADDKPLEQPVVKRAGGYRLEKVTPVWANALKAVEYDEDVASSRYGEVTKWQYTEAARPGFTGGVRDVHPDRVFVLGDSTSDAIGFLEPVYNAFVSLEKVAGGSGESFLKNAARQIAVNYDKTIDFGAIAKRYGIKVEAVHEKMQQVARDLNSGNDVLMVTQGADTITPLVSTVADPEPTFSVNLQTVSAGLDIPSKILVGNQTGERASTEDEAYFNKRCQKRRDRDLAPEVEAFVRHLMRIYVLDETTAMLTVMWGDLTLPTQTERLANAKIMSEINAQNMGNEPTFSRDEVREAAGYDNDTPLGEDGDEE